jgi:hypothetical protein
MGNWVSTSVLVPLKGSVADGEATNVGEEFTSWVRPGILEESCGEVSRMMVVRG